MGNLTTQRSEHTSRTMGLGPRGVGLNSRIRSAGGGEMGVGTLCTLRKMAFSFEGWGQSSTCANFANFLELLSHLDIFCFFVSVPCTEGPRYCHFTGERRKRSGSLPPPPSSSPSNVRRPIVFKTTRVFATYDSGRIRDVCDRILVLRGCETRCR